MPSGIVKGQETLTPLQERFIRSGFEGFTDQETIELLLSLVLPHRESKNRPKSASNVSSTSEDS